jgi:hypothetical protein
LLTCVCSKITILFGTSGSIRETLRRGLASRPTFGDLGCSLKSWWLRPCHEPIAVREADQSAHVMRGLVPGYAAGHRSDAGTACFHISACKGIGVHKGSFAVSPRFRRLAGDSSGSQPPVQLACCFARSSPLRAQERRVFACPVLYRSGALGGIRTPDPQIRSLVLYPAELRAPRPFLTNSPFEFHLSFARPQARHVVISWQAARDERHPPSSPAERIDPRVCRHPRSRIRLAVGAGHAMSTSAAVEERPWPSPISPHSPGSSA